MMDQIDFSDPDFQAIIDEIVELWGKGEKTEACQIFGEIDGRFELDTEDPANAAIVDALYDIIIGRIGNRGAWELNALKLLASDEPMRAHLMWLAYESTESSDETRAQALAHIDDMDRGLDDMERTARDLGIEFRRPARRVQS